jgi:hypothetical protein
MVSLPIPANKKKEINCYFMQYDITEHSKYKNYRLAISVHEHSTMMEFREQLKMKYGIIPSSYLIAWVQYNRLQTFFNCHMPVSE